METPIVATTPRPIPPPPPGQLRRLEIHGIEAARQQGLRFDRSGAVIKITLRQPGLYLVTAEEIAGPLGLPVSNVARRIADGRLSLRNRGQDVAWLAMVDPPALLF